MPSLVALITLPLAFGAGVVALAVLHYAFWTWRLGMPAREDEVLFATTRDGWRLALGRCRAAAPARRPPVLLVPGIAMNRQAFEFGLERYALADDDFPEAYAKFSRTISLPIWQGMSAEQVERVVRAVLDTAQGLYAQGGRT